MEIIKYTSAWFAPLLTVILFIRHISISADADLSPEYREEIAYKLLNLSETKPKSWVTDFTYVFDRFFGEKHFTLKCMSKSFGISLLTLLILISFALALDNSIDDIDELFTILVAVVFIFGFFVNAIADYISLLETRVLISLNIPIYIKILIDIPITIIIITLWISFIFPFIPIFGSSNSYSITEIFTGYVSSKEDDTILKIFLITTFTTSIWLWLHGLSELLIKSISGIQWFVDKLNITETPIRAIGLTINMIILTVGTVLFPVFLYFK